MVSCIPPGFSFQTLVLALFEADSWCSETAFNLNLTRENSKISWKKNSLVLLSLLFIRVQFELALDSIRESSKKKKKTSAHVARLYISNTSTISQVLPLCI